jgi:hypothetical protein
LVRIDPAQILRRRLADLEREHEGPARQRLDLALDDAERAASDFKRALQETSAASEFKRALQETRAFRAPKAGD